MNLARKLDMQLEHLVSEAKERKLTRDELRTQREAFVYGNLPLKRQTTRAQVRETLAKAEENV